MAGAYAFEGICANHASKDIYRHDAREGMRGDRCRCAARRFGLRPPRFAAQRKSYATSWDINKSAISAT